MTNKNIRQVWVSDEFRKKLKREAVNNNLSILEYTDLLAKEEIPINRNEKRKKTIW